MLGLIERRKRRRRRQNNTHFLSCVSADSLICWLSDRCASLALRDSSVSRAKMSCVYHLLQSCFSFFIHLDGHPEPFGSYYLLQSCFSFFVRLHGQPEPFGSCTFSGLALLSSSVFTANLSCLLATTFSSLRFLSNSFSSIHFNLLRVARHFVL